MLLLPIIMYDIMHVILPLRAEFFTRLLLLSLGLSLVSVPLQGQTPERATPSSELTAEVRPLTLTLDEAVALAVAKSPTLEAARLGLDGAKVEARKTRAGLLPTVSLSGSYSYMLKKQKVYFGGGEEAGAAGLGGFFPSDGIEMGEKHTLQGGLVAGMPLVAPQLWASLRLDRKAVELAEEKARGSQVALEAEVKKSFLAVLLAKKSLQALEASYANAQANYEQTAQRYQHGLVAEYDKLRMETQVKNLLPNLVAARSAVQLAEAKLKVVMGLALETPLRIQEDLDTYSGEVYRQLPEAAERISLSGNSQLRELDLQGGQLEAALKVKQRAFLPTLSLSFNYMYNYAADRFHLRDSKRWSPFSTIGLALDVPLYKGGARLHDIRATQLQIRQLGAQRVAAEQQLRLGLLNGVQEQRNALEQFAAARDALTTAERGHDIARVRYRSGESTILELNDAETALLQSRLNYSQAVYNYMVAVFSLDELRGKTTVVGTK